MVLVLIQRFELPLYLMILNNALMRVKLSVR